jgi:hypothetical protein
MALAPDLSPAPPLRRERGAVLGIVVRLSGLVALAAIIACAFVWISTPRPQVADTAAPPWENIAGGDQPDLPSTSEGVNAAVFTTPVAPSGAEPGISSTSERALPDFEQRFPTGVWPLPDRRGDNAPSPISPTTGTAVPSPAAGLQRPAAPGPAGPSSSASSPSAPTPSGPSAAGPGREEVATLIARGQTYFANGDVVSARLVFRRAAEAGDAQAALALGGTYDPLVLKSLGVIGVVADAAQARSWYHKAAELGSREAPQRIDQLAQWTR